MKYLIVYSMFYLFIGLSDIWIIVLIFASSFAGLRRIVDAEMKDIHATAVTNTTAEKEPVTQSCKKAAGTQALPTRKVYHRQNQWGWFSGQWWVTPKK
jgi:hypothetical protein